MPNYVSMVSRSRSDASVTVTVSELYRVYAKSQCFKTKKVEISTCGVALGSREYGWVIQTGVGSRDVSVDCWAMEVN